MIEIRPILAKLIRVNIPKPAFIPPLMHLFVIRNKEKSDRVYVWKCNLGEFL